jgi:drug/metabolite transporter (DMT)-like permease
VPHAADGISAPSKRPARARLIATSEGTSTAAFSSGDWLLLSIASLIWGSSFLLIAEGLESLEPGTVTWLRILFGFAALSCFPSSRRVAIAPEDRTRVVLVGLVWMAFPMTMFPIAEQWLDSSVTGMLNGSMPLFATAIAATLLRRAPGRTQLIGLAVGFVGVVMIGLPSLQGGSRTAAGAGLVILAMMSYGIATNLVVPLQHRYGGIPVIRRALLTALVLTAPFGIAGLPDSSFEWRPVLSVVALGALGTGIAFIVAATLVGRVGATRGSVIAYLIPAVALVLGVLVRDEHVAALAIAGMGVVLIGAWITSRAGR